jgi:hypothetical protein
MEGEKQNSALFLPNNFKERGLYFYSRDSIYGNNMNSSPTA